MADGTAQNLKDIVRRYYDEVFTNRNIDALDGLFAPDFIGHSSTFGSYTLDDMRSDIENEFRDMPEDETIVEEQFEDGDRVVSRWTYRWKHTTPLFGELPTGEWLAMEGIHIDRLSGGKIAERWEIKDFCGVVTQLRGTITFPDDSGT